LAESACGAFSERAERLFTTRGQKAWFLPATSMPVVQRRFQQSMPVPAWRCQRAR